MGLDNTKLSLTHEVVESTAKAKLISEGYSAGSQYKYRASAVLIGHAPLRPYDPIHLVGLRDGMSGVWVVISVTHVFNDSLKYIMKVHVGSNDNLLSIRYKKAIKDVSKTLVTKYPKILGEQDKLFTRGHRDSKNYVAKNINTYVIPHDNPPKPSWVRDPVKEFIDANLPTSSRHVNPFENHRPNTNNSQKQPKWDNS